MVDLGQDKRSAPSRNHVHLEILASSGVALVEGLSQA